MGVEIGEFGRNRMPIHKRAGFGLCAQSLANLGGTNSQGGGAYEIPDQCWFDVITGSSWLPDIGFGSGTVNLVPAFNGEPGGGIGGTNLCTPYLYKCYITSLKVYVTTNWTGGTGGTTSLAIQDTAGTPIAGFSQAALATGNGFVIALPEAAAVSGVADFGINSLSTPAAASAGLQAVAANSTAGVVRLQITGFWAK
jgi:hypothetical protein